MYGKSIPPQPSGGSPSDASTMNLDLMPPRGEMGSIGEKRDSRGHSSRRNSPTGGSASRPKAKSVGSLPCPSDGTGPTMTQSSSGAALPSRWCDAPQARSVERAEIRSCPRLSFQEREGSAHCFDSEVRSRGSHFSTPFAARHQSQSLSIAAPSHPSGTGLNLRFSPSSLSKHSHPPSKPGPTTVRCRPVTVGVTRHTSHFFPSGALKFMYGTLISACKQKA
jgi:hypothetical protein